jgi:serine phosphatase RsbU (regulator of sigma subunit)
VLQEPYQSSRLEIPEGHRLLLFSDGVNEQRGPSGEQLGTDRMLEFLAAADGVDADVEGLLGVLRGHSAGLPLADDVSLMSLQHDASGETRQG